MGAKLLTGATDGIGLDLARLWHGRGERTWLHGRRPGSELEPALFGEDYLRADLTDPAAPERIARRLEERGVTELELLLLNAAQGWVGAVEEQPPASVRALLEVDLIAPLHLCHLCLPHLRRGRGRVAFVSSIAAHLAAPRYAVYAAAKAAAEGFFRSLAVELADEVEVQVLRLGAVRTELHAKSGLARTEIPWERFPSSAAIARELDAALSARATWRTLGTLNRALAAFGRALPAAADGFRMRRVSVARAERPGLRRCAITGAAQGIGRALADRFARAGSALCLIDVDAGAGERARAELEHLGVPVELWVADLTCASEVDGLLAELARREPFDVFVHNAGVNAVGRFGEVAWKEQRRVLELNLVAPLVFSAGLLGAERLAPGGTFVFVSSLSRFVSYPGAAVYAATKAGLAHFARSLRVALAPGGQHVLTVYPGPTRTEHARRHSPDNRREAQRMAPAELAERVFRALERRQNVLVPGFANQFMAALGHVTPWIAEGVMKRALFDRLGSREEAREEAGARLEPGAPE